MSLRPRRLVATLLTVLVACGDDGGTPKPDAPVVDENHPPTVAALMLITDEDTPVSRAVVATDPDGDPVTITLGTPAHGTATLTGAMLTYTPEANYHGVDAFTATASDGTTTAVATIDVTIDPVNDAPIAVDDSFAAAEDLALVLPAAMVLANDTDVDGDTLTVVAVAGATHGTVTLVGTTITFTPTENYSGPAAFTYLVTDGTDTDTGNVTLTVSNVNDPPIAVDDTATTPEDTTLVLTSATLTANDTDADGQTLVVTAATGTNGTVTVAAGTVTYEPPKDFFGTMTITYTVSDGLATDTADVTVTVTPVDDPPAAVDDTATTAEDITLVIPFATLLANDTDVDGPTPTITATSTASHLTATVGATAITVVPDQDFFGTGGFDYTMTAGTLSTTAHVTVTITPVNDAPVAVDDARGVQIGTPSAIPTSALLANDSDVDGPAVSVVAVGNLVNCTATLAGATVTVTATAASATFDYTISDGLLTDVGTVTLTGTVAPVCGDGAKVAPEACDDGNGTAGDGCNAGCAIETGYACTGTSPSVCTPICGDNLKVGAEQCDNGGTDLDGCTSQCVLGRVCNAAQFPGGDHFAVDPATGHCYVGFDDDLTTWADAETACTTVGAHLATITSAGEDAAVHAAQNAAQNPWIGGLDDANDTDAVFAWVTGEAQGFTHYAAGQPDDDFNFGGNGECLHLVNAASEWNDTNCDITSFVVGRVCEAEVVSCGDAVREIGEACDDGNRAAGDGCSATCAIEPLTRFTFTGALGSEATVAADSSWGLAAMPVMARGVGVASVAGADTFAGKGWSQLALLTTDYFAFTVTPATGRTLHLTRLELDERRSLSGPLGFAIRSSLDGFAADLVAVTIPDDDLTRTNEGVDLPAAFASVAGAVEFRIYGYGAELAAGTWRVDNVELTGTSTLP